MAHRTFCRLFPLLSAARLRIRNAPIQARSSGRWREALAYWSSGQSEETRARPMGARDFASDCGQRAVASSGICEAFVLNRDCMRTAVPFAHQPRPRSDFLGGLGCYLSLGLRRSHGEPPSGRFAESTIAKLLDTVGDR